MSPLKPKTTSFTVEEPKKEAAPSKWDEASKKLDEAAGKVKGWFEGVKKKFEKQPPKNPNLVEKDVVRREDHIGIYCSGRIPINNIYTRTVDSTTAFSLDGKKHPNRRAGIGDNTKEANDKL